MRGLSVVRGIHAGWLGICLASQLFMLPALMTTGVTVAQAEELLDFPAEATAVIPNDVTDFTLHGADDLASVQAVSVANQAFTRAARVTVKASTADPWEVQLLMNNPGPLAAGDVLLATLYLRCQESMTGECLADVKFELARPDYTNQMHTKISAASDWKRFDIPFKLARGFAPDEARLTFQLGYGPQQVDIAGVELTNYGPDYDISKLPKTELTYAGREDDAPWRASAQQRIDQHRKGDMIIRVVDASGQPIPDAQVRVRMVRHAFKFGTAVTAEALADQDDPALAIYREKVAELFNEVTLENDLKWKDMPFCDPADIEPALGWLTAQGISVRGHVLVWPGWEHLPDDLQSLQGQPDQLRDRVAEHVNDTATQYVGRLVDWDVLNEPFNNHDLMDILGREVMVDWFKIARASAPDAALYINDWGILTSGNTDSGHVQHYLETIRYLLDHDAPIDGVGMQGHFGAVVTPPTQLLEILDKFAVLELPIKVTELDMAMPDESLKADYMRDVLTVLFSHPSVNGVILWGFWEGRHWRPGVALFDRAWDTRPHGQAWLDLVHDEWWTNEVTKSNQGGIVKVRGFLGTYEVIVTHDSKQYVVNAINDTTENSFEVICR